MSKKSKKLKKRIKRERKKSAFYWTREDYHHFCWVHKRGWHIGWAKLMREHPYTGAYIPQMTLHRDIHQTINHIPVPDGSICRRICQTLDEYLKMGCISLSDTPVQKMQVLYDLTKELAPETAKGFKKQLEMMLAFYPQETPE